MIWDNDNSSIVIFTMRPGSVEEAKRTIPPDNRPGTNVMIKGNYVQLKLKLIIWLAFSSLGPFFHVSCQRTMYETIIFSLAKFAGKLSVTGARQERESLFAGK